LSENWGPLYTPAELKTWVDKTNGKLNGIDPSAWSDVEKADFAASLTDLKKTILTLLKK
jgi:ParB family chromosome partitioning protein